MVKSIYNVVEESRNWDAKTVVAVDKNGAVTIRSTPVPNECGKNKGGVGDLLNKQTKERS
jgi:hypothetical protein